MLVKMLGQFMRIEYVAFCLHVYSFEFIHSLTHPLNKDLLSIGYVYAMLLSTIRNK